ncbi:unnamed protein product [Parnassius apollo]|uniref:(apollo) hypothetical protein n=1 Tax=Parnassius apollo TaxID=110799 RepID=A0A8S3X4T6_PARAO|nr:unnamed protein product [Parnassius apollo]
MLTNSALISEQARPPLLSTPFKTRFSIVFNHLRRKEVKIVKLRTITMNGVNLRKKNRTSVMNCSVSMISKYDKRSAPAASVSSGSEWSEKISSSGEKYYYNRVSELSQWEKPREWDSQRTLSKDSTYSSRSNEPEAVLPTIVNIIKSSVFLNSTRKQNFKCKTRGVTRRRFLKLKENFKNQKQ